MGKPKQADDDEYWGIFWHGFGSAHSVSGDAEDRDVVDLLYDAAEEVARRPLRPVRKIGFY